MLATMLATMLPTQPLFLSPRFAGRCRSYALTCLAMALKGQATIQSFLMGCLRKDANVRGTMSVARVTYKMGQKK